MAATTQFRISKMDENENARHEINKIQAKKLTKEPIKRSALGELGNRVVRNNAESVKDKEISKDVKAAAFKHVKPRVDSHWRKIVVPAKPITRSESQKSLNTITAVAAAASTLSKQNNVAKATASEKPVLRVAQIRTKAEPKKVKVIIKREESHLSRRSLIKIKALRKDSSSESSENNDDAKSDISKEDKLETHSSKLLEEVENIDGNDAWNPMLMSEYVNDIYSYLNDLEVAFPIKENYLEGHKEINHKMRTILIDWINEVHFQFKLELETYHMTVSIIDRYLQTVKTTPKKQLQLVGVTAMFIASKYEELFPPDIHDFAYITDDTYKKKQILEMEKHMVKALDFHLGKPLPIHFLRRFSKAAKAADNNHLLAKYLIELASIDYTATHFKPSEIAAAALYISLTVLPLQNENKAVWTKTLEHYTSYSVEDLKPIVQKIAQFTKNAPSAKVQAVYSKYSSSKYENISQHVELYGSKMDGLIKATFSS